MQFHEGFSTLPKELKEYIFGLAQNPAKARLVSKEWKTIIDEKFQKLFSNYEQYPSLKPYINYWAKLGNRTTDIQRVHAVYNGINTKARAHNIQDSFSIEDVENLSKLAAEVGLISFFEKFVQRFFFSIGTHNYPELSCFTNELKEIDNPEDKASKIREWFEQEQNKSILDEVKKLHLEDLLFLPDEIGYFQNLNELDVRRGIGLEPLTSLPESIGHLSQLEELDIYNCELTSLPESSWCLEKLKSLSLCNNQLSTLPESVRSLKNLESLNLSRNQLTSLPDSLRSLKKLHSLDLNDNQLTSLPESVCSLKNLKSLKLGHNQLTSLPESIGNLKELRDLVLGGNPLKDLPKSCSQWEKLNYLEIFSCPNLVLPDFIRMNKKIHISRNRPKKSCIVS